MKPRLLLLICLLTLLLPTNSKAQTDTLQRRDRAAWQEYLTSLYTGDTEDAVAMEQAYERLMELEQSPLDVNTARHDEFSLIPGLSPDQISDIIEYRNKYGNLQSLEELAMIASIDDRQRHFFSNFLKVSDGSKTTKRLSHDLTATMAIPTYYRAGDIGSGSTKYEGKYLGDPLKHSLRYRLAIGDRLSFAFTAAKSAGEPFFRRGNGWGYDRYAYCLTIRPKGAFRNVIVGKYQSQFGMGLIMNNSFTVSKLAMLSSAGSLTNAFTTHSSTTDNKYLQGVAATAQFGRWSVSAFLSYRYIDATLNDDNTISTILTSAYHRTETEMAKKNNATQFTAGANANYSTVTAYGLAYEVGVTLLHSRLNRAINPVFSTNGIVSEARKYRLYYPAGQAFSNASLSYSLHWRRWSFAGETACDGSGNVATINSLSFATGKRVTLSATQRFFPYRFQSLYGSVFSEGGSISNESGVCLGAKWMPTKPLQIQAYSDIAYFPWRRYLVSKPSYVWDNNVTATYRLRHWTLSARYRLKLRQRDLTITSAEDGLEEKILTGRTEQRLRLTASKTGVQWDFKSQVEGCLQSFDGTAKGLILSQSVTFRPSHRFTLYAHAAYFHTDDYDSRLYCYERGMLYTFNYSSYYGHGVRAALFAKARLCSILSATAKASNTHYFDRDSIGTAEATIYSNHKTDIELQIQLQI